MNGRNVLWVAVGASLACAVIAVTTIIAAVQEVLEGVDGP
jgi:hypothetical protein